MIFNYPLEVSIIALLGAQILKFFVHYILYKKWYPSLLFSTGGMPSSHSAFVTALAISLAITEGIDSPLFAISFVLAGVVIHDAVGVRREAGKHATVLNQMAEEFNVIVKEYGKGKDKDIRVVETKLKELLGHEPIEALSGTVFGIVVVLITYFFIL